MCTHSWIHPSTHLLHIHSSIYPSAYTFTHDLSTYPVTNSYMHTPIPLAIHLNLSWQYKRTFLPKQLGSFQLKPLTQIMIWEDWLVPRVFGIIKFAGFLQYCKNIQCCKRLEWNCASNSHRSQHGVRWIQSLLNQTEQFWWQPLTCCNKKKNKNLLHACHVYSFSNSSSFVCRVT